jgi:hypothetical protein
VRRVHDRGGKGGIVRRAKIAALKHDGAAAMNSPRSNDSTIGVMDPGHLTADRFVDMISFV